MAVFNVSLPSALGLGSAEGMMLTRVGCAPLGVRRDRGGMTGKRWVTDSWGGKSCSVAATLGKCFLFLCFIFPFAFPFPFDIAICFRFLSTSYD